MPTTRSTLPINRSGLQRGSQQSKRKRSIGNADEQTRKRHKEKFDSDIGEEEGEKRKDDERWERWEKGKRDEKSEASQVCSTFAKSSIPY
jgi:hypothetical protein